MRTKGREIGGTIRMFLGYASKPVVAPRIEFQMAA
jgi:hypothetical protein